MQKHLVTLFALGLSVGATATQATPLMSADWAAQACQQWNKTPALTDELAASWIKNDGGRGYKIVQMYRTDCGPATKVEIKIQPQNGKAMCTYGGKVQTASLSDSKDYVMYAPTKTWKEMGAGEYGPKGGMFFHSFRFDGPSAEAMGVMGAFEAFVLFPGKIPGEDACPAK